MRLRSSAALLAAPLAALLALAVPASWGSGTGADEKPLRELGRLIVLSHGRTMPLDSFARLTLYQVSGRRSVGRDSALVWLSRLLFEPTSARLDPVFLVGHPDTLPALGIPSSGRGRYAYADLEPGLGRLAGLAAEIRARAEGAQDLVEADILRLNDAVVVYHTIAGALDFARPDPEMGAEGLSLLELLHRLEEDREARAALDATSFRWFGRGGRNPLKVVPVGHARDGWLSPESALLDGGEGSRLALLLGKAVQAWDRGDWNLAAAELGAFNADVDGAARGSSITGSPGLEILYNRSRPFVLSAVLSLVALLFALATRGGRLPPRLTAAAARAPLLLATLVHSSALALRIAVTGRPPVTGLYSSFLFVAWLLLAAGLALSFRRGERLGLVLGPLGAFLLTALSGKFAPEGDELGVLQAVLDSNFWLSTHVVTISMGYGGAVASALLGHAYLLSKIARPADEAALARISRFNSLALMLALLFTFAGTMLGGIWADQSWGRFWGWDPKENGALLIVLWIAILQHARLGRMIDQQGLATGSVLLALVLLFSWIGVNILGVGLHSYGWTQGSLAIVVTVGAVEIAFALLGSTIARLRELPSLELRKARVRAVRAETPDAVTVTLELGPDKRLECRPGAYVTLFAKIDGITYRRAYSISAMSKLGDRFDITVKRVQGGVVSEWIPRELRPGSRLDIAGPAGAFGLNGDLHDSSSEGAVFVAVGSGIAPLMPMAEEYFRLGGKRLLLLYGSRSEAEVIFSERLERLRAAEPGFEVRHVFDSPAGGLSGPVPPDANGRITGAYVLAEVSRPLEHYYYLCGPESMVDGVRKALLESGVDASRVREERFAAGMGGAARERSGGGVVLLRSSGRELRVPAGQSILEAALRSGVRMPHGCVAGRCRECAARVLQGTAAMEEPNALSASEREGGVILTCVSYPEGRIELDA